MYLDRGFDLHGEALLPERFDLAEIEEIRELATLYLDDSARASKIDGERTTPDLEECGVDEYVMWLEENPFEATLTERRWNDFLDIKFTGGLKLWFWAETEEDAGKMNMWGTISELDYKGEGVLIKQLYQLDPEFFADCRRLQNKHSDILDSNMDLERLGADVNHERYVDSVIARWEEQIYMGEAFARLEKLAEGTGLDPRELCR